MRELAVIAVLIAVYMVGAVCANTTSNNTTVDKINLNTTAIEPLASGVSILVEPTSLNLGTVDPDGIERAYYTATTVSITTRRGTLQFSARASGDLINTGNSSITIPLSNLKYGIKYSSPYGQINVPKKSFSTSDSIIWTYNGRVNVDIPIDYYFTVPPYTDPGIYTVTIIYTAT